MVLTVLLQAALSESLGKLPLPSPYKSWGRENVLAPEVVGAGEEEW